MKLDRDINTDGEGKYVIVNLRKLTSKPTDAVSLAAAILANPEAVEFGRKDSQDEFFVIKLKDVCAYRALKEYASAAKMVCADYSQSVMALAMRAGPFSKFCKKPD